MQEKTKTLTKNSSSFLMQGMFLAMASLISRIIGLIYRVPLTAIIGKTGNDYYGTAFSIYNILLIISSYSLPLAMSKMVAGRLAEKKIREVSKVFKLGLVFALITGGTACITVFVWADFFAGSLLKTPHAAFALRILSPALLIVALLGVFRGFFQGMGTMIPSAISQVLEQTLNAVVSICAAYVLFESGKALSLELAATKGAGGATLGTVSGAMLALVFLVSVSLMYRRRFNKKKLMDINEETETTGRLFLILILTIVPVLLSTTLYNISSIVNQGIYKNLAINSGHSREEISSFWGVFSGQYNVIINVPLAIANSIAASIVPSLSASYRRKDYKSVKVKIGQGLRFISMVSFPCMIGFLILAMPIMRLLFNDYDESSGYMLMLGSVSVLFASISTLSNGVLQGIDKMRVPVIHAAISLVFQALLLIVLINFFDLHIYGVILANIFYAVIMCILNGRSVKKYTGYRYSFRRIYIIPMLSSIIMGIFVLFSYIICSYLELSNLVITITGIILGVMSYSIFMCLLGGFTKKDILKLPRGEFILNILVKVRLIG